MKHGKKKRERIFTRRIRRTRTAIEADGLAGRPTKFSAETCQRVIEAIKAAASYEAAASYAGISYRTLRDWILQGEEDRENGVETDFSQFSQELRKAEGTMEVLSLASIRKTGVGGSVVTERTVERANGATETIRTYAQPQWQALAWILTNRFRHRWGQQASPSDVAFPQPAERPVASVKREVVDIYDPDRLARVIGAFAEAGLVPPEIVGKFAL